MIVVRVSFVLDIGVCNHSSYSYNKPLILEVSDACAIV